VCELRENLAPKIYKFVHITRQL